MAAGQSDVAWDKHEAAQPSEGSTKQDMQALQLLVSMVVAAPRTLSLILLWHEGCACEALPGPEHACLFPAWPWVKTSQCLRSL